MRLPLLCIFAVLLLTSSICLSWPYTGQPNWQSDDERFTTSVAVADVDHDGYQDIIAANYKHPYDYTWETIAYWDEDQFGDHLCFYLNDYPAAGFGNHIDFSETIPGKKCWECLAVGDYNHDSWPDLAAGTLIGLGDDGFDYVFQNIGGNFSSSGNLTTSKSQDTHCLRWADVNLNGLLDLLILGFKGEIDIYYDVDNGLGGVDSRS